MSAKCQTTCTKVNTVFVLVELTTLVEKTDSKQVNYWFKFKILRGHTSFIMWRKFLNTIIGLPPHIQPASAKVKWKEKQGPSSPATSSPLLFETSLSIHSVPVGAGSASAGDACPGPVMLGAGGISLSKSGIQWQETYWTENINHIPLYQFYQ